MALPKEPRQKMINIMYLVLTALLALNVSAEILNAFETVNNSLLTANGIADSKNTLTVKNLEQQAKKPETAERASIWLPKAQKARQLAADMSKYIDDMKAALIKGSLPKEDGTYAVDNLDAASRIMLEQKKGKELEQKLATFKEQLLAIDPKIKAELGASLPINLEIPKSKTASKTKDWSTAYFHMTPTVAAITILSKFQNDVKTSEAQIVDYCQKQVGAVEIVYDQFQAIAFPSSEYLMPGKELVIRAGVGAFSKAAQPQISIGGRPVPLNNEGVAEWKTTTTSVGSFTQKVVINFKDQAGKPQTISKDIKYEVGAPTGVTVSADAVKVLYVGVPDGNPVSIAGGAAGAEKINASMTNGQLRKLSGGKYAAFPQTPGVAKISVSVEGKTTAFEFKVKRIPDPVPMIGIRSGGNVPAGEFKSQAGVRADLQDFVFEGIKYTVSKFRLICTGKGFEATGPQVVNNEGQRFNEAAQRALNQCRSGSSVIIDNISVSGPDGTRTLKTSMAFSLIN